MEEEEEVFPKLVESATEEQLDELGRLCEERILAGGGAPPLDPAVATKEELYEEAKRIGIEGRSEMTKDELAAALQGG